MSGETKCRALELDRTIEPEGYGRHVLHTPNGNSEVNNVSDYIRLDACAGRSRPDLRVGKWTHHETRSIEEQSSILPFLNDAARKEWLRRHRELNTKLQPEMLDLS